MNLVSKFILRETNKLIIETDMYEFIIPRNVVVEISMQEYSISRTVINLQKNSVTYLLRKTGETLL
jgi:hypothetical protein